MEELKTDIWAVDLVRYLMTEGKSHLSMLSFNGVRHLTKTTPVEGSWGMYTCIPAHPERFAGRQRGGDLKLSCSPRRYM